jgi:mRNA-degrading endonuclease RelE of RelBE toxin-antitoxin system
MEPEALPYRIEYSPEASNHFAFVTARQQSIVFDGVDEQLSYEPTVETRNRKRMRPNPLASWELRIGDLRVYYDVADNPPTVMILAIGIKRGNCVYIGGEGVDL